jgi:hypothetical protein
VGFGLSRGKRVILVLFYIYIYIYIYIKYSKYVSYFYFKIC